MNLNMQEKALWCLEYCASTERQAEPRYRRLCLTYGKKAVVRKIGELARRGYIRLIDGDGIVITDKGVAALAAYGREAVTA